jgi:hypothetical protein
MKSNLLELSRIWSNGRVWMREYGLGLGTREHRPIGRTFDDLSHALEPEGGAGGALKRAASAGIWEAEF